VQSKTDKDAIKAAITERAKELVGEAMRELTQEAGYPLARLAEFANAARVGQLLTHVLATARTLFVSQDADDEDGKESVSIASRPVDGAASNVTRETILGALEAICGKQRKKSCPRCNGGLGKRRPLSEFPVNMTRDDGRGKYCKTCERKRKQEYDEKKKNAAT